MREFTFAKDTLSPGQLSFHWASPPPADIASEKNLRSERPELVLYAVLARVREGDFTCFDHLLHTMEAHDDGWVWGCGQMLLSHAAPASVLRTLPTTLRTPAISNHPDDPDAHAQWLLEILSHSNYAWTVPLMFELYRGIENKLKFGAAEFMISRLIEPTPGPIMEGPHEIPPNPDDPWWYTPTVEYDIDGYVALVEAKLAEVVPTLPLERCIWRGELLDLEVLALDAIAQIRARPFLDTTYINKTLLEAYTGRSLMGFYMDNGRIDEIAAIAMLEELLESGELERYEPGGRYFFGREVPD